VIKVTETFSNPEGDLPHEIIYNWNTEDFFIECKNDCYIKQNVSRDDIKNIVETFRSPYKHDASISGSLSGYFRLYCEGMYFALA
jgi:hypothetical protein